jgi:hypothetical protein
VEEEGNGMEELEWECIIGGNGKEREMEVGTLKVYGKQGMCRRRDDKTEVKSLVLPETKKVAMALANLPNIPKRELLRNI